MPTRIFDILDFILENHPRDDAFAFKRNGNWEKFSTEKYAELANLVSIGLLEMGFRKSDRIATVSINNRPEWNFVDMGMSQIGVVHVPVYPTISRRDYQYIFNEAEIKLIFISDEMLYRKIHPIISETDKIKDIYTFDRIKGINNWYEIVKLGREKKNKFQEKLKEIKQNIKPEDFATLLYTSGTTGFPKGVMLSHRNIISNTLTSSKLQPLGPNHKVLSFLPLCHIFERTSNYQFQYSGTGIYYAENFRTIPENLCETNVDGFTTVPRLLEKVYLAILNQRSNLKGIKKKILDWSLQVAGHYPLNHKQKVSYKLKRKIAGILVFRKLRKAFGGKVRFIGCGGASLQTSVEKVLWAAGIPVFQGYGLTETSPLITLNHYPLEKSRIGTVGPVINEVQVKIAGDGEILCKGPNVMLGYYKNPELTKKVIDKNGWFHTGDIGKFHNGNFLKITGRKKELFKTSYGKYVAPQVIENHVKESKFIEQLMVIGEGERFVSAIISPNFDVLSKWLETNHKMKIPNRNKLIKHPLVNARFKEEINKCNQSLGMPEQIKQFILVSEEWSIHTSELSPTLKLRRHFILNKYKKLIKNIYNPVNKSRN
ncbi:MAG: long-chain fatty acid--CoA ligase [Bacteroidales bacterium]|nr:long-chain fatty acid--CoA ligase [Bacteroidales bacterium]